MRYLILLILTACAPSTDWADMRYGNEKCIEGGLVGSPMKADC